MHHEKAIFLDVFAELAEPEAEVRMRSTALLTATTFITGCGSGRLLRAVKLAVVPERMACDEVAIGRSSMPNPLLGLASNEAPSFCKRLSRCCALCYLEFAPLLPFSALSPWSPRPRGDPSLFLVNADRRRHNRLRPRGRGGDEFIDPWFHDSLSRHAEDEASAWCAVGRLVGIVVDAHFARAG